MLLPFIIYLNKNTLAITLDIAVDIPAPVTPSLGSPKRPYIRTAFPITLKKLALKFIFIGVFVSPIPLSAADIDILKD